MRTPHQIRSGKSRGCPVQIFGQIRKSIVGGIIVDVDFPAPFGQLVTVASRITSRSFSDSSGKRYMEHKAIELTEHFFFFFVVLYLQNSCGTCAVTYVIRRHVYNQLTFVRQTCLRMGVGRRS